MSLAFVAAIVTLQARMASAQTLDPPFDTQVYSNPPISSWYGPRKITRRTKPPAFGFHGGVDFAESAGTPALAVEASTVTRIDFDAAHGGGYFVEMSGPTGTWKYLHTFSNYGGKLPVPSGGKSGWTLDKVGGVYKISRPAITIRPGVSYPATTISEEVGENQIAAREPVAPVGTSGGAISSGGVGPHLHVRFEHAGVRSNPLEHIRHLAQTPPAITISAPAQGQIFSSPPSSFLSSAKVYVKGETQGKDVNTVDFLVDGAVTVWPGGGNTHSFQFGGIQGGASTYGADTEHSSGAGVAPVLDDFTQPTFYQDLDFSSLSSGQHQVCVQSNNVNSNLSANTCLNITVDTTNPSSSSSTLGGGFPPAPMPSTFCYVSSGSAPSGISTFNLTGPGGFTSTGTFNCASNTSTTQHYGPFCNLTVGTYTVTTTGCSGNQSASTFTVISTTSYLASCGSTGCDYQTIDPTILQNLTMKVTMEGPDNLQGTAEMEERYCNMYSAPGTCFFDCAPIINCTVKRTETITPASLSYTITNATTPWVAPSDAKVTAELFDPNNILRGRTSATCDMAGKSPGGSCTVAFSIPEGAHAPPKSTGPVTTSQWFSFASLVQKACSLVSKILTALKLPAVNCAAISASDFVFTSTSTLNFTFADTSGVGIDTHTLQAFRFDGVDWSSAGVTMTEISKDGATGIISATATYTQSGEYGLFFTFPDTVAPTTTLYLTGSTVVFDGAVLASTNSYVLLVAADPPLGTFSSLVASTTYRLDAAESSTPFSIYSSSFPLAPGTHTIEYRSIDYAGNYEPTRIATVTVTSGSAFRNSSTTRVPGTLLIGTIGSGAEFEAVATAGTPLAISSANRQVLVSVDDTMVIGHGLSNVGATAELGVSTIALQLRSGNSSASTSSVQIAFGYNGDVSYRHALRTEHSTATDSNRMDFLIWNAASASSTTLATANALSLQGIGTASNGSFHVVPVGQPDVEVEVSNGSSVGGGTIQYAHLQTPSSREFKTDIFQLSEKDEAKAMEEVSALRHARFRYKVLRGGRLVDDPTQPLHTGLVYEDVPQSIRIDGGAVSTNERIENAELALKAAMKKLQKLRQRYMKLRSKRTPR